MNGHFPLQALIVTALSTTMLAAAIAATVLKAEPPMGALKEGQRVLVDDGSCGPGQIREVIGGNHTKVGGKSNIIRQYRCIPR
ncbi:DUF6719 family protein [Bradyrhizobium sp.]|uniref:DUF6719 family protein n=1 Tax=Bradyrhizobium sp. TaxID=376 RepID=UPI001E112C24|nr:DUF6719 family protein [Bradyrhizobium sp.]MBI5322278.1 hypothetical protein [Bradyrhizobium sp.]